jgi:hypothetical protein
MIRLIALSALFGALGVSIAAADSAEESAVIAVEDEWIRAEIDHDEATLREVIDDRFTFNSNSGQTSGKEDMIQGVLASKMSGQNISERSVLVDDDVAMIFGTAEFLYAVPDGEDATSLARYTSVYVKRDGQWRVIGLHMAERVAEE